MYTLIMENVNTLFLLNHTIRASAILAGKCDVSLSLSVAKSYCKVLYPSHYINGK